MDFSDMYITTEEFFTILQDAWRKSELSTADPDARWHPEDIICNFESVFEGVSQGIVSYVNLVSHRVRNKPPATGGLISPNLDPQKIAESVKAQLDEQRVQVFGGTLPKDYNANKPVYANNTFGDNV